MARTQRCAACKAPVPAAAAFCPGCGRFVAEDEKALDLEIMASVRDEPRGDAVVKVGAGEQTRRQLMVIGAVLLLLIVIAVFVGNGRTKKTTTPSTSASTVAPTTTVALSTTIPQPTFVPTVPDATTSTTVEHFTPVEATPAVVFAGTQNGSLVRIDLMTGTVTRYPLDDMTDSVVAVRGGVFFRQGDNNLAFFSTDPSQKVTLVSGGVYLIGTPDGQGVLVEDVRAAEPRVTYIGADLVPHPLPISIRTGFPVGLVSGGVIVQTNGLGLYRLDLETGAATRVLNGSYLASRGDEVAGVVCDEVLRCELQVTVNGRIKYRLPVPEGMNLNGDYGAALSPDGKQLAYAASDPARGGLVGVVNLATGQSQTRDAPNVEGQPLAWTPSGRSVLWVQGGSLLGWPQDGSAVVPGPFVYDIVSFSVA